MKFRLIICIVILSVNIKKSIKGNKFELLEIISLLLNNLGKFLNSLIINPPPIFLYYNAWVCICLSRTNLRDLIPYTHTHTHTYFFFFFFYIYLTFCFNIDYTEKQKITFLLLLKEIIPLTEFRLLRSNLKLEFSHHVLSYNHLNIYLMSFSMLYYIVTLERNLSTWTR